MLRARGLLPALAAVSLAALAAPASAAPASAAPPARARAAPVDTSSALARTDPGYGEAMALAEFLQDAGIRIAGVHRSTFAGLLGDTPCASYDSERGTFCAFFLEEPDGAERATWDVRRHGGVYRYTFRWTEAGRARTSRVTFDGPQRIVRSGPWFVLAFTDSAYAALRDALALPRRGIG